MSDDSVYVVYVTAGSMDQARSLGRRAVEARLAACCNILPAIESIYEWEGKVVGETEVAFLLKTTARQLDALTSQLATWHSYKVPCIVAWPIAQGHAPFVSWVREQTR